MVTSTWVYTPKSGTINKQIELAEKFAERWKKYGAKENPVKRAAIHSKSLTFIHPVTQEEMNFETKVPDDYLKLFRYKYYD